MAVVISAMAPPSLHGPSRLSRASSRAMPPPPPAPAKKDAQDTLFTEEEFQALISGGQCEFLSFAENSLQSSSASASPLLSIQLQAQMLCREEEEEEEDDAYARFQEMPPSFALDGDVKAPVSDDDIERIDPLFCDEKIQAICADSEQQAPSMQFSTPRSDDHQVGKKRMPSPPWPSCIAEADEEDGDEAGPPPLALPGFPPPTKKARTETKRRGRSEHGPPPPPLLSPPPPAPIKKQSTRTQTKSRISRRQHAGASATQLRKWHNKIATRTLTRQFRPPELSRRRTALRCQCPELELDFGCCALHQDVLPGERDWMYSADQGHGFPPLVGGPGVVLVPHTSAGCGKAMVLQYVRWRHSVSLPTRFYVQRAVMKKTDDDRMLMMMPEYWSAAMHGRQRHRAELV